MKAAASFFYASRILFPRSRDGRDLLGRKSLKGAMLCIGISLVPLIAVLVISQSMIQGMTSRMIHLATGDLQITYDSMSRHVSGESDFLMTASSVKKIDGVKDAVPEVRSQALASKGGIRTGAMVRGVESDLFSKNKYFSSLFDLVEGSCDLSEGRSALVSNKMAERLSLKTGDSLTIITINSSTGKMSPKASVFKVKGIISSGYQELDQLWIFISISDSFSALSLSGREYCINLSTEDPFSPELNRVYQNVNAWLQSDKENAYFDFAKLYTWKELNASQTENFSSTKLMLLLIMLLIVLVASINISSALVMIVMERSREIAILKSTGASPYGIALAFIITGLGCGLGGVLIGLPAGLFAAVNINYIITFIERIVNFFTGLGSSSDFHLLDPSYYIQKIEIEIPGGELIFIVFFTLILSLLVSLLPALKAAKEKPMDTLRKN
ncbi:FtsX-like permease family protein [Treponema sp.]|uniref:ABC transporter permease n=1 Tax=Treponema sp. TaxID=166 RepID=UPI0025CEE6C7|nr:FtsX-like permease family protein [Treponema sp.]MCR5219124.1 ABC transporter permease [Treponema sp.]